MKISLVSVYVDDPAEAFRFYREVLGFLERLYIPKAQLAIVTSPEDLDRAGLLLEPNDNPIARIYQEGLYNAGLPDATTFLWSDDFEVDFETFNEKYPWGSQEQKYATLVCGWNESLAALWVNGLMNEKLISVWLAVGMVWDRIKNYALGIREQS